MHDRKTFLVTIRDQASCQAVSLWPFSAEGALKVQISTHLAVVQLAQLLDDPLLQHQPLPQLFPVILHSHFALLLLDRVLPGGDGSGPHATHPGRSLEEDAAAGGRQRGAGLGAGGRHCGT